MSPKTPEPVNLRVRLVGEDVERFQKIKKTHAVLANTEVIRIVLKEACERLETERKGEGGDP